MAAASDTEKFATLFLVPKLVKGSDCDKTARLYLMKVKKIVLFQRYQISNKTFIIPGNRI